MSPRYWILNNRPKFINRSNGKILFVSTRSYTSPESFQNRWRFLPSIKTAEWNLWIKKVAATTKETALDEFLQVQVLKSWAIWSFDGRNSEEGTNSNNINSNNNNSNNDNVNLFRILRQHFWFKKEEEEDETGAETMAPTTLASSAPSVLRPPRYCLYWSLSWEKRCMRQCYGTSWQWLQCKSIVRVVMVSQW